MPPKTKTAKGDSSPLDAHHERIADKRQQLLDLQMETQVVTLASVDDVTRVQLENEEARLDREIAEAKANLDRASNFDAAKAALIASATPAENSDDPANA